MQHPGPDDPYRVLGVDTGASPQDIARAYRRAAQHAHPDTRPHDRQAAARFQALTDAYGLLRDPGRRAAYDRGHPADEPYDRGHPANEHSDHSPQPSQPVPASRWGGRPLLLGPPPGQLIWAGPVHIEPPTTARAATPHQPGGAAAEYEDPVVILGARPGQVWGWPW